MEEQEIPCQGCGKAATGKLQISNHFTAYLCPNASACIDKMQTDIMNVGVGGGHGGGHGFGGGGSGRMHQVRSVGPARHHFGGGRRSFGHPGFRPYYTRYYRGFLGNPMWAAYPWFRYYRYAPYDSPFWYLLSLYPLGDSFWNTFRYYPPADPYWEQYESAVSSGYDETYDVNFSSHHLCSKEEVQPVVFSVSSEAHGAETWVLSESGVTHRQRPATQLSASLWGALVTVAEHLGTGDWLDKTGQPTDEDTRYRMRMNDRDYELVSSASGDTSYRDDVYNTSDMRLLQNVVLGATTKIRDTSILFHRAMHRNNSEEGTLVMASGRIYRYDVAKNDATLEEKLRGAKRLMHCVDGKTLGQLKQLAAHLADAPYSWSGTPVAHADKTVMLMSYDDSRPTLVMSKGRLQQHYDSEYDVNVSRKFHRLYKKYVGSEYCNSRYP